MEGVLILAFMYSFAKMPASEVLSFPSGSSVPELYVFHFVLVKYYHFHSCLVHFGYFHPDQVLRNYMYFILFYIVSEGGTTW